LTHSCQKLKIIKKIKEMEQTFNDPQDKVLEENLAKLSKLIASVWRIIPEDERPKERKPTILICGQMGVGKSTTINTLFGDDVADVGYFTRGTAIDEIYDWVSENENINVIDLPGLGDGESKAEKEFRQIYKKRIKEADAIIVVATPPRPASYGTIKTVNLLLSEGVHSSHIIFGLNKLNQLMYKDPDTKKLVQVGIDGLIGPTKDSDLTAIAEQKKYFLNDLNTNVKNGKFNIDQIVEFDSITGWNLHEMLHACVDKLPGMVARRFRLATLESERAIRKREVEKYEREKKILEEELKEKDRQLRENEAEAKRLADKAALQIIDEKNRNQELERQNQEIKTKSEVLKPEVVYAQPFFNYYEEKEKKIKKRGDAIEAFDRGRDTLDQSIISQFGNWVAGHAEKYDKNAAKMIRDSTKSFEKISKETGKILKNGWEWLKNKFR
jgi:predicted GTPase